MRLYGKQIAVLSVVAILVACGSPGYHLYEQAQQFDAEVTVNDQVDFLFVVDNTYSMTKYQQELAASFGSFINEFAKRDLDYHVGVISNEIYNTLEGTDTVLQKMNPDYWTGGALANVPYIRKGNKRRPDETILHNIDSPYVDFPNAGPGSLLAFKHADGTLNPAILSKTTTKDTADLIQKFRENVALGAKSPMAESGLSAVVEAIRKDTKGGPNEGFFRPNAPLIIVMLSNEDDSIPSVRLLVQYNTDGTDLFVEQSPHSVAPEFPDARYGGYKDASVKAFIDTLAALKPGHQERIHFTAIVVPTKKDMLPHSIYAEFPGTLYSQMASQFNGETLNIHSDFNQLASLGQKIVKSVTRFDLDPAVDPNKLHVFSEGKEIPKDDANGWAFVYGSDATHPVAFELRGSAVPASGGVKKLQMRFTASKAK